ncbi:MAG: putative bifunctional diguanylate cyclase/phosphodiesterase [Miltoncostaeaceae bacterium]
MLRNWLDRGTSGELAGVAKRQRRLTMAQLIVLVVGALASVGVAILLLNAIVDGERRVSERTSEQERLVEARQTLQFLALNALAADAGAPTSPRLFIDVARASADLRSISAGGEAPGQTPAPGAGCSGCTAEAERARVIALLDRMDDLTRKLVLARGTIGVDGEVADVGTELVDALNAWVVANRGAVQEIRETTAARNRALATLGIAVIAAVSIGSLLLWVLLDRVRARTMRRLARDEARFHALARNSSDVVLIVDTEGVVRYASPSVESRLGTTIEDVAGRRLASLVHPDDVSRLGALDGGGDRGAPDGAVEWRRRDGDARWIWIEALITDARDDPSVSGWVVNTRDVSDRKAAEDELTRQAFEDSLTSLPNRALFGDRLRHALAGDARAGEVLAVALIDLDDFKTVNDSLGHAAGDGVLKELGSRIASVIRAQDTASRLGGDEFAILFRGADRRDARMMSERIVQELARPISVEQNVISMQSSIGVALSGPDAQDEETLLRNADVAMYAAKAQPGGSVQLFRQEMQAAAHERLELKQDLVGAMGRGELSLNYQPIFRLDGEALMGFEALLRWEHPERGMVPPETFIPLAEQTGLIHELGRWVIDTACSEAALWARDLGFGGYVTVNVSGAQLDDPDLSGRVAEALRSAGLGAESLVVEITESALPTNPERAVIVLQRLRNLGIRIAIDDFGTGYSSLSYLGSLPVDVIKMDKCFVDDLVESGRESDLAATILRIGKGLGLTTVAEGIELQDQADRLRELGCGLGQGYFFSRPMPSDAARALVSAVSPPGVPAERPVLRPSRGA